jgi:predicted nucleic acid-binding protein
MTGVLVESDLIVEFLTCPAGRVPLLRRLLETTTCYTTFLNAAEIYAAARGDEERRMVERALFGLKILGASSRYAKTIGEVLSSEGSVIDHRTAIVAGMAIESGLPVVTGMYHSAFSQLSRVRTIAASALEAIDGRDRLAEALEALA